MVKTSTLVLAAILMRAISAFADPQATMQVLPNNVDEKAIKQLKVESKRGSLKASYQLGIIYLNGIGVPKNPEEALDWFEDAGGAWWGRDKHKLGLSEAQYMAGTMYRDGIGTEKDLDDAEDWFSQAAEQGYPQAQLALSEMYLKETELGIDYKMAYFWSAIAAGSLSEEEKPKAEAINQEAAKMLSPEDLEAVRKRVAEWSPQSF